MNERRSLPALLVVAVLAAALVLGFAAPGAALAAGHPGYITKALDFFHAKQQVSGGFAGGGLDVGNATPWVIFAIAADQENPRAWDKAGKDPFDYLQATNLETQARDSLNPPAYYAKVMLAYYAMGLEERIGSAGTPRINLLEKLQLYRYDREDDPATAGVNEDINGHYTTNTSGDLTVNDVNTTTWALLALMCTTRNTSWEVVVETRSWLIDAQNADGGWGINSGVGSSVDQTAATIQALVAGGAGTSAAVDAGMTWLRARQLSSTGGFPYVATNTTPNAESTSWAVQAGIAAGSGGADWVANAKAYLKARQRADGSFTHAKGATGRASLMTSTQVAIALGNKAFPFVRTGTAIAPRFLPSMSEFKPGNGAKFTTTNDVAVRVAYADNKGGTGIAVTGVRVFIDGVNRTRNAKIGSSSLSLDLIDVPNGSHSVEIRVKDRAGNTRTVKHTFTVSVSTSSGSTPPPSYNPGGSGSSGYTPSGSRTPTPTTTLYPTPGATPSSSATPGVTTTTPGSVTGTPLTPSPGTLLSPSGSPAPYPSESVTGQATGDDGGIGSGEAIGGVLLAMLPAGAALSYLMHRRQAAALAAAGQGKMLPGGGTPWQRFKARLPWSS